MKFELAGWGMVWYNGGMKILRFLMAAAVTAAVSCTHETKQLRIDTQPQGADVSVNGKYVGKSPVETEILQRHDQGITASKEGYENASSVLRTKRDTFLGLLWGKEDPRSNYIEEDQTSLILRPIPTINNYTPTEMPSFEPERLPTPKWEAPALPAKPH